MADLAIIIVNWRVRPLLEKCLNSILANSDGLKLQILVVDNDSRDGTPEMVMVEYPQVTMISLARNIGFARANNLAMKQAKARYYLLLNPDTEIVPGFFRQAIDYLDGHPEVSIVGPKIINPDGSTQLSISRFPDLLSQVMVLLKLRNVLVGNKFLSHYLFKDFDYSQEQSVEQIMGAAILVRPEVFEKIGTFDEHFFVWFEEVDFCKRAKKKFLDIRYVPHLSVIHYGGESFSQRNMLRRQWIFDKSLFYYFFKHQPIWQWLLILFVIPVNLVLTLLYVIWLKHQDE